MCLHLILPQVKPEEISSPEACPNCGRDRLRLHQVVEKPLRDTQYARVPARRYQCQDCEYTLWLYPRRLTRGQTSQGVKGLAILLYLWGLSYEAVSLAPEALGVYLCKSPVYDAVQEAAKRVLGMRKEKVFAGVRTPAVGSDVTSVRCRGRWLPTWCGRGGLRGKRCCASCTCGTRGGSVEGRGAAGRDEQCGGAGDQVVDQGTASDDVGGASG